MVSAKKQPQPDDAGVEHNVSSPDDRNRIHEAAAKLFESQGYSQTTLTEIARLAGVCLDVVEEHGLWEDGWESLRWEVYDKARWFRVFIQGLYARVLLTLALVVCSTSSHWTTA